MKKLLLLLSFASAQINYSGEINPSMMTRKSDQSQINLPFRIATLEGGYTFGNVDLKTSIAIEHRWNTSCLLYTSPSPRDKRQSRMPSSA